VRGISERKIACIDGSIQKPLEEKIMSTVALTSNTLELLNKNQFKYNLINELNKLKRYSDGISAEGVAIILGQWYHPLHYFPVFLSSLVAIAPSIEMQTHISRILWQELGEGDPAYSHEKIYIETMTDAGVEKRLFIDVEPFRETSELLSGYKASKDDYLRGLGFLYATEIADLVMVSTIGHIVREFTGKKELPWIDIHVKQEPDHVESSSRTLQPNFTDDEQTQVIASAEQMWILWINFFKAIKNAISGLTN
jgi:hypothetical protein